MTGERQPLSLPLTPGPWIPEYFESHWRIVARRERPGMAVVIADLTQPSQANAALIAAAPRMLDLLLRWSRAGDAAPELQYEARVLIAELEAASPASEWTRLWRNWGRSAISARLRRAGVSTREPHGHDRPDRGR
jgi:hypothetical protein